MAGRIRVLQDFNPIPTISNLYRDWNSTEKMMGVKRIKNVTNNDRTNEGAFKIDEKKYKKYGFLLLPHLPLWNMYTLLFFNISLIRFLDICFEPKHCTKNKTNEIYLNVNTCIRLASLPLCRGDGDASVFETTKINASLNGYL